MKAVVKFLPIIILAGLMICKVDALIAAPIAVIVAIFVARGTDGLKFAQTQEAAIESVTGIVVALFILMFAYAMANSFMSTGVGAAVIRIALELGVTGRTVAIVALLTTGVLSVATGTSWGTFAACAPIFLWLSYFVGAGQAQETVLLTLCSTAGGACFGDAIGLISDCTIVSSGIHQVEVTDRFKNQGIWAIICFVITAVIVYFLGVANGLSSDAVDPSQAFSRIDQGTVAFLATEKPAAVDLLSQVAASSGQVTDSMHQTFDAVTEGRFNELVAMGGIPYYMGIPLLIVIGLAIAGLNTFVCIGSGILSSYILGIFCGTVDPSLYFQDGKLAGGTMDYLSGIVMAGFADAGSWVIVMMMWVAAFGGIMRSMNAFDPLAKLIAKISGSVKQLMFWNGCLCLIGNAILSDEMAQIVTIGPITKGIVEDNVVCSEEDHYKLRLRNATFASSMGVFGSQLIPWHVYLAYYVGIAMGVFPIAEELFGRPITQTDVISQNVMAMVAVLSLLLLTITGADKFIPGFRLPREPEVYLKKKADKYEKQAPKKKAKATA